MSDHASYSGQGPDPELEFQHLVDRYYRPLYRFALSLTHTETAAGDLVQETFLAWAAKGHQLKDRSKARSWLFTTLHRLFLEQHRRSTRFPHLELDAAAAELPSVDPQALRHLDAHDLVQLLAKVDPQFQAAVALFYLEDYSYAEIASIVGVPLGTVKSRLARGIAQLKGLLGERTPAAGKPREGIS